MIPSNDSVSRSIGRLLEEYILQPVQFMREVGQQARLRELLLCELEVKTCAVQVADVKRPKSKPSPMPDWKADRVQLEAKIQTEIVVESDPVSKAECGASPDRSDLVVLRADRPITLTRFTNGAFDIVARVLASDVECVVELKAACTADKTQRHAFREDIKKLWSLAPDAPFARHFVLVDKSLPLPGMPSLPERKSIYSPAPIFDWHTETQATMSVWKSDNQRQIYGRLAEHPRLARDVAPMQRHVHVWDLEPVGGDLRVRHRYASFS
jgi:hypothetical protein